MPLSAGDRLGPYEILAAVGAGGMGEVYRARDSRLDRTVALKVSKADFSERFEREARAIAALNHPHICHLHDVGPNYLVMEFIEGTPLKGPMPVEKAVEYAGQILDALDAAHKNGLTHRDLKPGNILVSRHGIKLLDFGLAKHTPPLRSSDTTVTMPLTESGVVVGTPQYMSPEQLHGKEADARSDLFSFGCVLYEMLSGKRAFPGASTASVMAAILEREPEPLETTPRLDRVIKKCLAKDPDQRFQNALDLKTALLWAMETVEPASAQPGRKLPWILAAAFALAAGLVAFLHWGIKPAPGPPPVSFQIVPSGIARYRAAVLSPDGRRLAFLGQGLDGVVRLFIRNLDSLTLRALPEGEGSSGPIWSPDGRSLAFASEGKLKTIDTSGGAVQNLCDWPEESGAGLEGSWSKDGLILFRVPGNVIRKVASSGGACADVAKGHAPTLLPDGRHFLYYRDAKGKEPAGVYAGSVDASPDAQESTLILAWPDPATYVPSSIHSGGYLSYMRDGSLVAQPFDPSALKVAGEPFLISGAPQGASLSSSFSQNGVLAWFTNSNGRYQLVWYDRKGAVQGSLGDPGDYGDVNISPDGKLAAVHNRGGLDDLWLFEFARGTITRFTSAPGRDHQAVWSPDSNRLIWSRQGKTEMTLYVKPLNGAGAEKALPGEAPVAWDWSPDGRFLAYGVRETDLNFLPLSPEGTPAGPAFPYFGEVTPFPAYHVRFSPNGRWIVYTLGAGSRAPTQEVYVGPFPAPPGGGSRWTVSSGGGYQPLWRRDGKELFFLSRDGKLMSVDVKTDGPTFQMGTPKPLFDVKIAGGATAAPTHRWDVSLDGQRFLISTQLDAAASPPITVLTDWEAGLKK